MGALGFLIFLLLVAIIVIWWIASAKTYLVARTAGGSPLTAGTSNSERPAAEELYALIGNEAIAARLRLAGQLPTAPPPPAPAGPGHLPPSGTNFPRPTHPPHPANRR